MSNTLQTVGDFRRAWAELPDSAPVEIMFDTEHSGRVDLVTSVRTWGLLVVAHSPTPAHLLDPLDMLPASRVGVRP